MSDFIATDEGEESGVMKMQPEAGSEESKDMKEQTEGDENEIARAISADISYAKSRIAPAALLTVSREYITVVVIRTQYSRLKLRFQFTDNYPHEVPVIELSSPTLPSPLLNNKSKECCELCKNHLGQPQFHVVYEHIHSFVLSNLFLSCWKEIKQVKSLCEEYSGKMGVKEEEGILQFRLKGSNGYFQNFDITIPYFYPEEAISIEFLKSNFPDDVQRMCYAQAETIVARCLAGISPNQITQSGLDVVSAVSSSALKGEKGSQQPKISKLTSESIKGLKHDVNILKQMSELRAVDKNKDKRNQFSCYSTQERKNARKDLRRLAKKETCMDEREQQKLMELEQSEVVALMGLKISETAIPSLVPVCQYLIKEYVGRLSSETCQNCEELILPDQRDQSKQSKKKSRNMKHTRANCGHWFHYHCLHEMLTTPPFLHHCSLCKRKVSHPDWSDDIKQMERAWNHEQAKKRELADVSDFLDVSDNFKA